jgi:hypothetical protein
MHSSFKTYDNNSYVSDATQVARVLVTRILSEVRTADSIVVNASGTTLTIIPPYPTPAAADTVVKMEYEFVENPTGTNTLTYKQTFGNGSVNNNVLMGVGDAVGIGTFNATAELLTVIEKDASGNDVTVIKQNSLGHDVVNHVTVSMLIGSGNAAYPFKVSVAPRRVQVY